MRIRFCLMPSCHYVPEKERDWNKLAGYSMGLLPQKAVPGGHPGDFQFRDVDYLYPHHANSIRLAWRDADHAPIPLKKELFASARMVYLEPCYEMALYIYDQGHRYVFPLPAGRFFKFGETYEATVEHQGGRLFWRQAVKWEMPELLLQTPTTMESFSGVGYKLSPYFGGFNTDLKRDTPAPHEMNILLEWL